MFKTFSSKDTISRDKRSNDLEFDNETPLLSNSNIEWIIFLTRKKIKKALLILYTILPMNQKLFNRE